MFCLQWWDLLRKGVRAHSIPPMKNSAVSESQRTFPAGFILEIPPLRVYLAEMAVFFESHVVTM
jgi:hypothetical protein